MIDQSRTVDNRPAAEMMDYQEARIAALRFALRCAEGRAEYYEQLYDELRAERKAEEAVR